MNKSTEDLFFLDSDLKDLRNELLSEIYKKKAVNSALLNVTDLDIYSKDFSFFSKIGKSIRSSILDSNVTLTNEQEECLYLLSKDKVILKRFKI